MQILVLFHKKHRLVVPHSGQKQPVETTKNHSLNGHMDNSMSDASGVSNCDLCSLILQQVYNGTGDDAVVMATLCGSTVPDPIFVTTNSTWMRFITDESRQMHGFDITYISSIDGR